jgi:Cu2+-exporting ATPase
MIKDAEHEKHKDMGNHEGMHHGAKTKIHGDVSGHDMHEHQDHHAHMVKDFKKRFWVSLVITIPVLVLSPFLQSVFGTREIFNFPGDIYVLFALTSFIYV